MSRNGQKVAGNPSPTGPPNADGYSVRMLAKRKTPRKVLSIVKGNGYGHGGPQVAKILEKAGSDWFGRCPLSTSRKLYSPSTGKR